MADPCRWDRTTENLYSAWIEKLFDAPLDAEPSWKAWHEVLHDRSRNFLFDYLGAGEDGTMQRVRPDCADFVYFLRAYFAYKMRLPFGYSNCSRGFGGAPPKCYQWFDIEHPGRTRPSPPEQKAETTSAATAAPPPPPANLLQQMLGQQAAVPDPAPAPAVAATPAPKRSAAPSSFSAYLRDVGDVVQSGAVRVAATDDNTDFYTVPLSQEALRPGTVYADPYGHVLMLVRLVPEANGAPGVFLAVDAEPDGTVTRKRFWRGNFLFVHEPALGSPGFKRFRPIVREANGALRRLTNAEIAKNPQYGDFSLEQSKLDGEAFYDRMDEVMSPQPLDPLRAMTDAITSLQEQVQTRVVAVENGRKYQNSGKGEAEMPNGAAIFETTGAWEDFSTPARDFRLLIAIDVVRGFPDRVERRPERYAIPFGKSPAEVKAELQSALASELSSRKFSYTRSDGSAWTLDAQGRRRARAKSGNGLQPERLCRVALGRARRQRGSIDLQAACAGGAAREDDWLPQLVPRAPLALPRLVLHPILRHPRAFLSFVTTGLDPVVHADVQRIKQRGESERASFPHGLPGQARQ